jgi:hypothetical protein
MRLASQLVSVAGREKQVSKCKQNYALKCGVAYVRSQTCLFDVFFVIVSRWMRMEQTKEAKAAGKRAKSTRLLAPIHT